MAARRVAERPQAVGVDADLAGVGPDPADGPPDVVDLAGCREASSFASR